MLPAGRAHSGPHCAHALRPARPAHLGLSVPAQLEQGPLTVFPAALPSAVSDLSQLRAPQLGLKVIRS